MGKSERLLLVCNSENVVVIEGIVSMEDSILSPRFCLIEDIILGIFVIRFISIA